MNNLHERLAAYPAHALGGIRRGIEKEGLRVLPPVAWPSRPTRWRWARPSHTP